MLQRSRLSRYGRLSTSVLSIVDHLGIGCQRVRAAGVPSGHRQLRLGRGLGAPAPYRCGGEVWTWVCKAEVKRRSAARHDVWRLRRPGRAYGADVFGGHPDPHGHGALNRNAPPSTLPPRALGAPTGACPRCCRDGAGGAARGVAPRPGRLGFSVGREGGFRLPPFQGATESVHRPRRGGGSSIGPASTATLSTARLPAGLHRPAPPQAGSVSPCCRSKAPLAGPASVRQTNGPLKAPTRPVSQGSSVPRKAS